jgi:hypothetical protein
MRKTRERREKDEKKKEKTARKVLCLAPNLGDVIPTKI